MTLEEKKEEYANLIVKAGAAVRPGQNVWFTYPIECYEFARLVVKKAYEAGARLVKAVPEDDIVNKYSFLYSPDEVFTDIPEWSKQERNTCAREDWAFIHLIGSDPEALKGVNPKRLQTALKARFEAYAEYYHLQSTMGFKWTILGIPTKAWATKVYPDIQEDVAVAKLWDAIFNTVRIGDGDSYEKWMRHADSLAEKTKKLTEYQFDSLHYENSLGTDFTVGLVQNHRWEGGADRDKKTGDRFFANMPTEEVFTMPDRRRAEGKLYAALPLSYNGNLIEKFWFEWKDGKVVNFGAEKGEEVLKSLLETDEGSKHLGEVALVPYPSPVSAQNILFLETLYDENAACHFALGECYETNLVGGENMDKETLEKNGGNTSANHVDFMVGTPDLKITGKQKDGTEVLIFDKGTWAI